MSGSVTTAFPTSFKQQLPMGMHCFTASVTFTANLTSGSSSATGVSSEANLCRGMPISGTGVAAGAFIADLPGASTLQMTAPATANATATTITASGDAFNVVLIKNGCTGIYGADTTSYGDITANSDEATGTGYTAGGQAMSANVTPATDSAIAYWSWSTNPSWTGATLDVMGCEIHNASNRGGYQANNAVYVGSFGGQQQVSNGTLTLVLPTNNSSSAILRIQ